MAVKFEQDVKIDAPPDTVWAILASPLHWPRWFPDLDQVSGLAQVAPGATFDWKDGDDAGSGTVMAAEPQTLLQIETRKDGPPLTHTFHVRPAGGLLGVGANDTQLTYRLEYDPPGGFISDFIAGGNPRDMLKVKGTLDKVKALAKGMAGR